MKKITFLITLILIVSTSIAQTKVQKYSIKSGYIAYELSGNTTGTKSIWWDDYGQKSRTEENSVNITKMFGVKSETKTHAITIINEGKFWTIDMNENTGQTGSVPYTKMQSDYAEMTEAEKKQFEDDLLDSFGGKRVGTEKVEGYSCEIIEMMGVKSWIYKGIPLKTEAKLLGIKNNEMFTQFKENIQVSAAKFEPPSGIQFNSLDQHQHELMGNIFDDFEEEEEEEEEDIIPVKYSFEKFGKIVRALDFEGYKVTNVLSQDGSYIAPMMKGFESISILAASNQYLNNNPDMGEMETFKHAGRKYHFGYIDDKSGTVLAEEYPGHDMMILFLAIPIKSKEDLLELSDKLRF